MALLPESHPDNDHGSPLELVLSRLSGVRRQGESFMARCPAHDDRTPSLSVAEGDDGRVLLKCFAGCETEAVVAAAGLQTRDLFRDATRRTPRLKTVKPREVEAIYDYMKDGELCFQVLRYTDKTFIQRRPDGHGKWVYKLDGVDRCLYHEDEVVASKYPVYVCEGEKDADRLRAEGVNATTNPGGAGKWRPEYTKALSFRDVVVLADNDDAGRKHALEVATELTAAGCTVRVPDLTMLVPTLPEKGDVSDILDAGHTISDLDRLVGDTPPYQYSTKYGHDGGVTEPYSVPPTPCGGYSTVREDDHSRDDEKFPVESLADLLAAEIPDVDYVVDNLLTAGNSVLFSAREKTGKGLFFVDTAFNVATGQPVLGRTVKPGPVLYVALEENRRVIRDRFRARAGGATDLPIYILTGQPLDIMSPGTVNRLRRTITAIEARLVVIDTLRETHERNENNSDEMAPVARVIRLLAEETGACIAVTHHMSLGNRSRGSTSIPAGFPDVVEYHADEVHDRLSGVLKGKGRDIIPFAHHIAFDGDTMRWHIDEDAVPTYSTTEQAVLDVLNRTDDWLSPAEIADRAGKPRQSVKNALSAMRKRAYCPLLVQGENRETRYHGIQARTVDTDGDVK